MRRVTVNLSSGAAYAQEDLEKRWDATGTEVINRALTRCHFLAHQEAAGAQICLRMPDGAIERLHFL